MIYIIPSFLAGGIFRRCWGGFLSPAPWLKRVLGFLIPFAVAYPLSGHLWGSLGASIAVGFSWWGIGGMHGKYQRMGRGGDLPLWECVLFMGLNYSLYATVAAVSLGVSAASFWPLLYAPFGFLVPLSYAFWWLFWETTGLPVDGSMCVFQLGTSVENGKEQPNCFIDGPTSVAECFLGGIMMGGLALAAVLS